MKNLINTMFTNKKNSMSFSAKSIPLDTAEKMQSKLLSARSVDIFCHMSTDEDALNSASTIASWLKAQSEKLNKSIRIRIIADGSLKGLFNNKNGDIVNPEKVKDLDKADLAVVVDCNSMKRLSPEEGELINKCKYSENEILGFDHHVPVREEALIGNADINSDSPFYIDTSAKSCCAIVYRFFEATNAELKEEDLASLYCGMLDDLKKSECIKITNNKDGLSTLERTDKIKNFPETVEILNKIESKLNPERRNKIISHLDILSRLNPTESAFQKNLFNKVKFTPNGKLAYIVIPPENKKWKYLEQDNNVTSVILSDARQRLLENKKDDELIHKQLKLRNKQKILRHFDTF